MFCDTYPASIAPSMVARCVSSKGNFVKSLTSSMDRGAVAAKSCVCANGMRRSFVVTRSSKCVSGLYMNVPCSMVT